ncbi:hypothetical protein H5T56_00380 [Candidatus Bipolaricaulota bacterium]|nr:hypothetical protein [Candidatus Bipolaricaulota bacterium]
MKKFLLFLAISSCAIIALSQEEVCLRCGPPLQFSPTLTGFCETLITAYVEQIGIVSFSRSLNKGETFEYMGRVCKMCDRSEGWPALAVSQDGIFYLALATDNRVSVLRSLDQGESFLPVFTVKSEDCPDCFVLLYHSIFSETGTIYLMGTDLLHGRVLLFVGNTEGYVKGPIIVAENNAFFGRVFGYQGRLYSSFVQWSSPVDFLPPIGIPDGLAPLGDLLVQYCERHPAQLLVTLSSDGGMTWTPPKSMATLVIPAKVEGKIASFISRGLEAPFIPNMAVDANLGQIYVVFQGANEQGNMDVYFVGLDKDLEVTVPPRRICHEPNKERFLPNIAVASDGTIGVAFYELDKKQGRIELWLGKSMDGGRSFSCQRVSKVPSPVPPVAGQPTRSGHFEPSLPSGYIGESIGIWADETNFYLVWTDFRNTAITPDYPQGRPDMDLYFARIPIR